MGQLTRKELSSMGLILPIDEPEQKMFYDAPRHGWVCFHCGEKFSVAKYGCHENAEKAARDHFGPTPEGWDAACIERFTKSDQQLLMEKREAEKMVQEQIDRACRADEEAEAYAFQLQSWIVNLKADSPNDVLNRVNSLEGRMLTAEAIVREAEKVLPDFIADIRNKLCTGVIPLTVEKEVEDV